MHFPILFTKIYHILLLLVTASKNLYYKYKIEQICKINSTFLLYIPKNLLIILNKNKIYLNLNYKYKKR